MSQLHQLGSTQQALLRHLLRHPAGVDVESLCTFLRVSHNAVRQHLTALSARKWVERAESISTGGRPQARFRLTTAAHDLFPRNYALIAGALLEAVTARIGREEAQDVLTQLGRSLGESEPTLARDSDQEVAEALAERLSRAGYEAIATTRGGPAQVEAFNCVFHSMARVNSDVCRFDIAFMEAATGRRIQHTECIVQGGHVCRFLLSKETASAAESAEPKQS